MSHPTEPTTGESIAATLHELMTGVLHYDRFLTYGEDIGAGASDWLAATHPDSVLGIHAPHAAFPPKDRRENLAPAEIRFFAWLEEQWEGGNGYSVMQSTRPDTLATGLSDSPAGLAAWIVEKFHAWSDCGGDLESRFTKDQLLNTVMIYWITNSIGTSFRAYYDGKSESPVPFVTVPAGVTVQQHERLYPRETAERTYTDLRFFNTLPRGGHFTAAEEPALVAADIRAFVATL
jgi:pimeloyl-ACP methyl ester carboxylesterase